MQAGASPSQLRATLIALAVWALCLLALGAAPATAASLKENRTAITLLPKAAQKVGAVDLKLISRGIARGRGAEVWMPIISGDVRAKRAGLRHGGSLVIKARRAGKRARQLKLGRFELKLKKRSGLLLAREGRAKAGLPYFRLRFKGRALSLNANASTADLRGASLELTARGRRLLRKRLGLTPLANAPIARLASRADLELLRLPEIVPPPLKPLPPEPPVMERPASAVDITAATVEWCVRASWIRYIGNGLISNGASRETPFVANQKDLSKICDQKRAAVTSAPRAYRYGFDFDHGWFDEASQTAALYFKGTVGFRYSLRGIDLDFNDIEVELNGAATRTIFRVEGRSDTAIQAHRTVFTTNGDPLPTLEELGPGKLKVGPLPGWLESDTGAGVFADFYLPPNHDFGSVSVEFEYPSTT